MPWTSGCLVSYPQLSNVRSSYISYHYLGQKASKCVSHEQLQIPSAVFVPAMPYLFDCPLKNILERLEQTIFWSMMTKCQNASKVAPHEFIWSALFVPAMLFDCSLKNNLKCLQQAILWIDDDPDSRITSQDLT